MNPRELETPARHPGPVYAFECCLAGNSHAAIVNSTTRGKAKQEFFLLLDGDWPFTAIRARKLGAPHTSAEFRRTARYRGLPGLQCGDAVLVGGVPGVIVGHNRSANFDVLFPQDSVYRGNVLNVHPGDMEIPQPTRVGS